MNRHRLVVGYFLFGFYSGITFSLHFLELRLVLQLRLLETCVFKVLLCFKLPQFSQHLKLPNFFFNLAFDLLILTVFKILLDKVLLPDQIVEIRPQLLLLR
jgi:hypothetical protein